MTREEFIDALADMGEALTAAAPEDSDLSAFIQALIELAEPGLEDHEANLRVFQEEFISNPNRFRHELLGITAKRRQDLLAEHPGLRDELSVLGLHPDLLGPIERLHSETSHTRALAWLMSSRRSRIAPAPLVRFLALAGNGSPIETSSGESGDVDGLVDHDCGDAVVRAEHSFPGLGRVDLSLSTASALVLVEAKVNAKERDEQLGDYQRAALRNRTATQAPCVVFLNLSLDEAPTTYDEELLVKCPVVHVTFDQVLRVWLPVFGSTASADHRYAAQYLSSLAQVCSVGWSGSFDDWDFVQRQTALDFVSDRSLLGGTL